MGIYADRAILEQKQNESFMQAVNEAYFGRTAGINSLFNAYCDWREPLIAKTKYYTASAKNIYNKDMQTFRNMVCKQFGFKTFSYNVIQVARPNSCTFSTTTNLFRNPQNIIIDKNGYRYKDTSIISSIVMVFPDLVFNPQYTNEENFAVFLHEIGHNFQSSSDNVIFSLSSAVNIMTLFSNPLVPLIYNDATYSVANFIQNKLSDITILGYLYSSLSTLLYCLQKCRVFINAWTRFFLIPINLILNFVYRIFEFISSIIFLYGIKDYYGERFADGFAASYGFGEALASCFHKFDDMITGEPTFDDVINKCPIIGHIMDLACLPGMLLIGIIDVHPNTASRYHSILKDLKTDLNDPSLSPEMKKQLSKEIDSYEKAMNEYFDKALKLENPRVVSTAIQKWVYEKGGDAKFKLSEMPFKNYGGFRGETNKTKDWINQGKYDITKIKFR